MIKEKDTQILSHLRENARKKITEISRLTNIPVTTIYDRIRSQEKKFIKKHTTLLDFHKMGYASRSFFLVQGNSQELQNYLSSHPNLNNLYRIDGSYSYLAEFIFHHMIDMHLFAAELEQQFSHIKLEKLTLIGDIKREVFLPKKS